MPSRPRFGLRRDDDAGDYGDDDASLIGRETAAAIRDLFLAPFSVQWRHVNLDDDDAAW